MADIRNRCKEALKRAEAATGRPWYADAAISGSGSVVMSEHSGMRVAHLPRTANVVNDRADAEFVAEARADVPDFAGALLRMTGPEMRKALLLRQVRGCLDGACAAGHPCSLCVAEIDAIMALLTAEVSHD